MPKTTLDSGLYILVGCATVFILTLLVFHFVFRIKEFLRQLDYINREISRSSGKERKEWVRQKRQLWLSWLPFQGR